jgi:cytochrome c5
MQARKVVLGLAVVLVVVAGLVVSCGGPTPPQATPEEEAEPQPTEAPQEPQEQPTEPPAEEEPTAPPDEGMNLLEDRCTVCHGLDRVTRAQKTADEWAQTVDRMIDKGTQLDADERDVLIDYLTQTYGP